MKTNTKITRTFFSFTFVFISIKTCEADLLGLLSVTRTLCGQIVTSFVKLKCQLVTCDELVWSCDELTGRPLRAALSKFRLQVCM